MPNRVTIKDYLFESHLFMRRAVVALIFSGLLLVALISRLVFLQVFAHERFSTLSDDNRIKIQPLAPNRGLIFDRNGVILAENLPSYRLEITPELVKDLDTVLNNLSQIITLKDIDRKRFHKLRKQTPSFKPIPLRFHLSDQEVAQFAVDRHRFPGIDIVAGLSRHYPQGSLGVHALGYVGRVDERDLLKIDTSNYSGTTHIGKTGIEKTYENTLHGTTGYSHIETNAEGRILRTLKRIPPVPGNDIHLTIDAKLQGKVEEVFGQTAGAAVALNPNTGEILAFASLPIYDPNLFVNGIDIETYQQLQNDDKQPLFNRALRGQYPPGSTIKPFVALGALERHSKTEHDSIFCPGYYQLPGKDRKYRDWKKTGHGTMSMVSAITQSCDVYFYDLANTMGIDQLHDYLSLFGFGKRSGIDISGEASGLLPSQAWKQKNRDQPWYPGETLITGIGQGFMLTTPIQLASATATLATFGQHIKPRIVIETQSADPKKAPAALTEGAKQIAINEYSHWQTIIHSMQNVVHGKRGTARRIGVNVSYTIAGKTGTAQVFGLKEEEKYDAETIAEKLRDHSLFIAFAPADNPQIAIAAIVENGGSGSAVAAPLVRKIIDFWLAPDS